MRGTEQHAAEGQRTSRIVAALAVVAMTAGFTAPAAADPLKCQRAIAKGAAKYVQGRTKLLQACENGKVIGRIPPTAGCALQGDVPKTAGLLVILQFELEQTIRFGCGGADRLCGTGDDESLASIGWSGVPTCPDVAASGCTNSITDCQGIATCLACIDTAAIDQVMTLTYGALQQSEFGSNSAINKCQQVVGKATAKFVVARSKAMQKCWDARLQGLHANACPAPGDGRAAAAIAKAEAEKVASICKVCGGADRLCDGNGDLAPSAVGFAASCPAVTTFDASSCGGAMVAAADVTDCVDCVATFATDCMDAVAVPEFASPLDPRCN